MLGTENNSPTDFGGITSDTSGKLGAVVSISSHMNSMERANKSTIPHPSGPIIAGNCISCMGMVRISHSMSVNATVRCPHCQESFVLAELLDQSLPPLEVVANPQEKSDGESPYIDTLHLKKDERSGNADKPKVKFEIPKALRDGAKRKRRRRRRSRSSNGEGGSGGASSPSVKAESVSPKSVTAMPASFGGKSDSGAATETFGQAVQRRRTREGESSGRPSHRGRVRSSASRAKEAAAERSALGIAKFVAGGAIVVPVACVVLFWVFKAGPFSAAEAPTQPPSNAIETAADGGQNAGPDAASQWEKPSYLDEQAENETFVPEPISDGDDRIAIPDIDPDEVFGQEFGL